MAGRQFDSRDFIALVSDEMLLLACAINVVTRISKNQEPVAKKNKVLLKIALTAGMIAFRSLYSFVYKKPQQDDLSISEIGLKPNEHESLRSFSQAADKFVAHITRNRVTRAVVAVPKPSDLKKQGKRLLKIVGHALTSAPPLQVAEKTNKRMATVRAILKAL